MKEYRTPGKWEAHVANTIGAKTFYQVYRLRDKDAPDQKGNRDYCGGHYEDRRDAERLADVLNKELKPIRRRR